MKTITKFLLPLVFFFQSCLQDSEKNKNQPRTKRPNIIYILTDDLGTGDLSLYNKKSGIQTPHIDALAQGNTGFYSTNAHSPSAVCTPTRYSILTGKYNWRTLNSGVLGGTSPPLMEKKTFTVAKFLSSKGYKTACIGKWHLGLGWQRINGKKVPNKIIINSRKEYNGKTIDYTKALTFSPNDVGFDYYWGIPASLDMAPYVYIENKKVVSLPPRLNPKVFNQLKKNYLVNHYMRKGYISDDFKPEEVLQKITDKTIEFIDKNKNTPFFIYIPYASPHVPIVPRKEFRGKSHLGDYGDFVLEQDYDLGRLVTYLKKEGLYDNTIIIFTSDNGATPGARLNKLLKKGHRPSHIYRGYKTGLYEGGHRVPFIVKWHTKVSKKHDDSPILISDFFATMQDYFNDKKYKNHDSKSFLPILKGQQNQRKYVVSHSLSGHFAISDGEWKLILSNNSGGWSHRADINTYKRLKKENYFKAKTSIQLYNLKDDIGERNNLYEKKEFHKEAKRLKKALKNIINKKENDKRTKSTLQKLIQKYQL